MAISRKDKKLIFDYLLEAGDNGLFFGKILKPDPEPVHVGGAIVVKSVPKCESTEQELFEYWEELKRNGVIRPFDRCNPDLFVLTGRGKQVAAADNYDLALASLDIGNLLESEKLIKRTVEAFAQQRFEEAVFAAFRCVEESVRQKANLPAGKFGAPLIVDALHPEKGILRIGGCETKGEEEGAFLVFKGAIQLLKNPSSHRTVDWGNPKHAAQAILLADLLLRLLDSADKR